jgi:hypothetical protein
MEPLTFIIEYRSRTYPNSIFLTWYPGETDQFLTFKTGEIFATDAAADMQKVISTHMDELHVYHGLEAWLNGALAAEKDVFDMNDSHQALGDENYSAPVLKQLAEFMNLFGDYVEQDPANGHLYNVWRNRHLHEAWEYYYNEILWPGIDGREVKPLIIDKKGLVEGLEVMMKKFEASIRVLPAGHG